MMWHYTPTRTAKMKKGYDEDVEQLSCSNDGNANWYN